MKNQRLVIPGGSGFLGRTVAKWFIARGWQVIIFSRNPTPIAGAEVVAWDGVTLGEWAEQLEGSTAVLNLAGRSVNCRYHHKNREEMLDSRTQSTRVLGEAIAQCRTPPQVWLNSSTATIYRHRYDAPNTESEGLYGPEREAKDHFSLQVAHAWEEAFEQCYQDFQLGQTRGILLRTAMVFGNERGGVYETLRRLTRMGLGGTMGHGRQYVSWLHAEDFCRAVLWLIESEEAHGIYNLTAPNPLPNRQMMASLREALSVRFGLPAPRLFLEIGAFFLRTETELIVKSRRVVPERLLAEGFKFRYQTLSEALANLESESSSAGEEHSPVAGNLLAKD